MGTNTANAKELSFSNTPLFRKARNGMVGTTTKFIQKGKQNMIVLGSLIVLFVLFVLLAPSFADSLVFNGMVQRIVPYAIMGLGVTFVIATGGIDLSIGTVSMGSAFMIGWMAEYYNLPMPIAIILIIIVGGLFGLLSGYLVAKLKLPPFIATLGTMLLARGLTSIIIPLLPQPDVAGLSTTKANFPQGGWYQSLFSRLNGFPIGLIWLLLFTLIAMYLMYKCKVGRYILAIGSNEEAARLSGINTDKYKIIAYVIGGLCSGIAAIFYTASFPMVNVASGSGMELNAIAGVYIGGTSASGGIASVIGTILGACLLQVIDTGLNQTLAQFGVNLTSQHVTYVITGIIVVAAVVLDVYKTKQAGKVKVLDEVGKLKKDRKNKISDYEMEINNAIFNLDTETQLKHQYFGTAKLDQLNEELLALKNKLGDVRLINSKEDKVKAKLDIKSQIAAKNKEISDEKAKLDSYKRPMSEEEYKKQLLAIRAEREGVIVEKRNALADYKVKSAEEIKQLQEKKNVEKKK